MGGTRGRGKACAFEGTTERAVRRPGAARGRDRGGGEGRKKEQMVVAGWVASVEMAPSLHISSPPVGLSAAAFWLKGVVLGSRPSVPRTAKMRPEEEGTQKGQERYIARHVGGVRW